MSSKRVLDQAIKAIDALSESTYKGKYDYDKRIPDWVKKEEPKMKNDGSYAVNVLREIKQKIDKAEREMRSAHDFRQVVLWQEWMHLKYVYDYVARRYVD